MFLPCDTLRVSVKAISKLERALNSEIPYSIKVKLNKIFSQNISYKGLLCLEIILGYIYKNIITKNRLTMSNNIIKRLKLYSIGINLIKSKKGITKNILFNTLINQRKQR